MLWAAIVEYVITGNVVFSEIWLVGGCVQGGIVRCTGVPQQSQVESDGLDQD